MIRNGEGGYFAIGIGGFFGIIIPFFIIFFVDEFECCCIIRCFFRQFMSFLFLVFIKDGLRFRIDFDLKKKIHSNHSYR